MDLGFSADQEELRSSVRQFIAQEFPRDAVRSRLEEAESFDRAVWRKAARLGWAGLLVPEELGGGSLTHQPLVDLYVLVEELGRHLQPWPVIAVNIVAAALAGGGSDVTREKLLGPLLSGDATAAWCFAPRYPGGDGEADGIEVVRAGGEYRVNGAAPHVQDAQGTDFLLVDTVTDGTATRLVVPTAAPGVSVLRRQAFDLTRRVDKVTFTDVRVPGDAVLAPAPAAELDRDLRTATALVAADCVGGQEAIMQMATSYAKLRVAFGRTIGSFQAIKHKLATMQCLLESSRGAAYYAALAVNDDMPDAEYATAAAKSYVTDAYVAMAHENIEIHGGTGFTWEHDAHLYLRRAMTNQLLFGTSRDHRERVFALATDDHF